MRRTFVLCTAAGAASFSVLGLLSSRPTCVLTYLLIAYSLLIVALAAAARLYLQAERNRRCATSAQSIDARRDAGRKEAKDERA